ncbi:MAG: hypothetical protein KAI29_28970, partial [Cyclobacteriaceae bacterium]|nr:hypothetical protein [Cyclobacteriaceae bacterium]
MKSVIIILLINILFFISANILAQEEKYLLNTRGELVPVSVVEKYVKPQYNDNLKRNIFGDVLFDPNDLEDTLSYRDFFPATGSQNFGFFGQAVMIQWFVAPADMRIVAAGVMCVSKDSANTQAALKLVKFAWTLDEISTIETPINLGYYEAVSGGGWFEITAYLDNPDRTGPWVDVTGNGLTSPFGHDLWSNNGVGIPFVPVIDAGTIPENYNWVDMDILFEPEVLRFDVIGVSTRNSSPYYYTPGLGDPHSRIGWYAAENAITGLPPAFKFYIDGRFIPPPFNSDEGWWTREYTWDFVLAVVLTGDVPPSINSYTIIPSGIVSGPLIIDANIT